MEIEIQYQYKSGEEKLEVTEREGVYSVTRHIYSPRYNRWISFETLPKLQTKKEIILYLLEKDPHLDLENFIKLN